MDTRYCRTCDTIKPVDEFSVYQRRCRACNRKNSYQRYQLAKQNSTTASDKICVKCRELKPATSFNGCTSYCKPCSSEAANDSRRLRRYGVTPEDFHTRLISQEYKCLICTKRFNKSNPACVDHCHMTGRIRGLLCHRCNHLIADANENIETLRSAIEYILGDL